MNKSGILLCCVFVYFSLSLSAQKEANIWYFGEYAGLDFNNGEPVALTNSAMNQQEGCSSIADSLGNLLFYTNGISVWNKNHEIMPNGFGLLGHQSSTQSAIIVKKPGYNKLYYIFTTDAAHNNLINGFNYSIVDMNLEAGLGNVLSKNILLFNPVAEKVTAVWHENQQDVWVITHEWNSAKFRAYLLTETGLNTIENGVPGYPKISSVGSSYGNSIWNAIGFLKASRKGNKIGVSIHNSKFEYFDFDKNSGVLSNPVSITDPIDIRQYGVEFSPDESKLYVGKATFPCYIYQYDLTQKTEKAINRSAYLVASSIDTFDYSCLQLGPDSKIYVALSNKPHLSVINNPNESGSLCNYVEEAIFLENRLSIRGLPDILTKPSQISFNYLNLCFGDTTCFNLTSSLNVDSVLWNFGDPASGTNNISTIFYPFHIFSSLGSFQVNLTIYAAGNQTNITKEIIIHPTPEITLGNDTLICSNNPLFLSPGAGFQNYLWQDNSSQPTFTVNQSGIYWVEVSNEFGCTSRDSIEITITQGPEIFLGNDSTLCVGDTLVLSPGQFEDYLWQNGSTGSTFYAFQNGTFWVEVSDEVGCFGYDTITLNFQPVQDVFFGNDTLVCYNEILVLDAGAGYENYLWQDGSAGQTLFINQPGTFWVQVNNLCGSSSDTINVSFSQPFDISLGSDTSFCYGHTIFLDAGEGFSEYLWQNGSSTQTTIAAFTGNYWVEVTDSLGCTATDTIFIETFMDFDISIGEDVVKICKGDYIFLNGPGGYQNYLWQDGSDFTSLLADTAGIYWLEVTDENGCSARDSMQLVVNQIPSKILENDTTICPETELTLNALPGYSSYLWQDGSAGQDFVTTQPGKFWVTVQDEIGCTGTDSILVKPFQTPDLGVEDQEIICLGDTLVLNVGDENLSYLWQDGSDNPDFYVTEEGDYWVQIETICGFYTDSVEVQIYKGNLDLGRDTTLCDGEILKLDPGNNYSNHFWSNGSTESSILIGEEGNYWLKAFDGLCSISDTIYVEVCASIWVPNVFTPNSDGINDTFYAVATNPDGITAFKMTILNRWGRIVQEMGNINEFWDGKINGSAASPGAYFWVCDFAARDKTGNIKNHSKQGSVTLVR